MWYSKLTFMMAAVAFLTGCAMQSPYGDEEIRMTRGVAEMVEKEGTLEVPTAGTVAAVDSEVVCQRYTKTGSHMKETYCWTISEHADMQDDVRRQLNIYGPNTRLKNYEAGAFGGR